MGISHGMASSGPPTSGIAWWWVMTSPCSTSERTVTEAQRRGVSKLLLRFRSGAVPAGTRELKVELVLTRDAGSDNDGLADSLSLVFTDK